MVLTLYSCEVCGDLPWERLLDDYGAIVPLYWLHPVITLIGWLTEAPSTAAGRCPFPPRDRRCKGRRSQAAPEHRRSLPRPPRTPNGAATVPSANPPPIARTARRRAGPRWALLPASAGLWIDRRRRTRRKSPIRGNAGRAATAVTWPVRHRPPPVRPGRSGGRRPDRPPPAASAAGPAAGQRSAAGDLDQTASIVLDGAPACGRIRLRQGRDVSGLAVDDGQTVQMTTVLGPQCRHERRPPARRETVMRVQGGQAGEKRVHDPELAPYPGRLVRFDVAGEVRGARQEAGVVLPGRWSLAAMSGASRRNHTSLRVQTAIVPGLTAIPIARSN